jgi:DNA polymerase-3 subunit alpha
MKGFVHLHLHSQYSLLDGTIQFGPLVRRVKELGMPAVAVTDHGGMMGTIEFYEEANRGGVKPIIGTEIYVAPGSREERKVAPNGEYAYHLVLLAENAEGYRNLLRLSSLAQTEGFYYKPRVDKELLKNHSEGLIALSACLQGEIPLTLATEGEGKALEVLEEYRSIFDGGRFFLEVQDNGLPEQDRMNRRIIELAKRTGTPLVATNDCHYLHPEDARFHEILLCLQTGKTIGDPTRMRFGTDQFFVKTAEEFERAFGACAPEALSNTLLIAERCDVKIELGKPRIPEFQLLPGETSEQRLRRDAEEGFSERLEERRRREGDMPAALEEEYRRRLDYELSVIEKTGFSGYFLIVSDFIRFAKSKGIPWGRAAGAPPAASWASACGSPRSIPSPTSCSSSGSSTRSGSASPTSTAISARTAGTRVIAYVQEKYGRENVAQLITFGTWKPRAAIRDVGRVLEMPYAEVDRIAKLIPADLKMTLENAPKAEPG